MTRFAIRLFLSPFHGRALAKVALAKMMAILAVAALPLGASAQNQGDVSSPFSVVMKINDSVITAYELEQRILFLQALQVPGDPRKAAISGLINDRIAAQEARRKKMTLTPEEVNNGMVEFAGRANLSADEFIQALSESGVAPETFRDFVKNGLLWRELVSDKFAISTSASEAEVDRAIADSLNSKALQFSIAELILPITTTPENALSLMNTLREQIKSPADFSNLARQYSAAESALQGGQLGWISSIDLPQPLVATLLSSNRNGSTEPAFLENAVVIFQLRGVRPDTRAPGPIEVDYIDARLPEDPQAQAELKYLLEGEILDSNSCLNLIRYIYKTTGQSVEVQTRRINNLPADVALALAPLDPGGYSLTQTSVRMLCERRIQQEDSVNRGVVHQNLVNEKLGQQAEIWLNQLIAQAKIVDYLPKEQP